jgi:hypothetical protein
MQVMWFSFAVCSAAVVTLAVSLPTTVGTDHSETTNPDAPREFPKFNQNYTFVDNSSIRENLANHAENDTEVDDLLGLSQKENSGRSQDANVKPDPSEEEEDIGKKNDVEWIENGEDTEDSKFTTETSVQFTTPISSTSTDAEKETVTSSSSSTTEESTSEATTVSARLSYKAGVPLIDGGVAAILAGVFLVISICAYVVLLTWRRALEIKYGSREMLVDSDDMYDPDDMKHFSI